MSGTGPMDFADIVFGVVGFLFMYVIFAMVRGVYHLIYKKMKR